MTLACVQWRAVSFEAKLAHAAHTMYIIALDSGRMKTMSSQMSLRGLLMSAWCQTVNGSMLLRASHDFTARRASLPRHAVTLRGFSDNIKHIDARHYCCRVDFVIIACVSTLRCHETKESLFDRAACDCRVKCFLGSRSTLFTTSSGRRTRSQVASYPQNRVHLHQIRTECTVPPKREFRRASQPGPRHRALFRVS
jgi:hypothetical protein